MTSIARHDPLDPSRARTDEAVRKPLRHYPTRDTLHGLIELACRAPSVHNTQPWRWRTRGEDVIELWADRDRQLPVADPCGRNLAISCGAALHHLIVAGRAMGVASTVELLPSHEGRDLLASVRLAPARPPRSGPETLEAIQRRCTDRRRFTTWPIPDTRLAELAQAAAGWGAYAIPVLDATSRCRSELLLSRALRTQEADGSLSREQQLWTDHSPVDGIPGAHTAPPSRIHSSERPNRFAAASGGSSTREPVESSDGLIAICTTSDTERSWLEAGQVLSAVWLRATLEGLSLVPLSQVIEVPETRESLQHDLLAGLAYPQILLRIGWQEIARASLAATPRRPLTDVLA